MVRNVSAMLHSMRTARSVYNRHHAAQQSVIRGICTCYSALAVPLRTLLSALGCRETGTIFSTLCGLLSFGRFAAGKSSALPASASPSPRC